MAIVGPSGSGKSTLLHLLLRFWDYDRGRITLAGQELRRWAQDDVRRQMAVVAAHPTYSAPASAITCGWRGRTRADQRSSRPPQQRRWTTSSPACRRVTPLGLASTAGSLRRRAPRAGGGAGAATRCAAASARRADSHARFYYRAPGIGLDFRRGPWALNAVGTHRLVEMERMDEILVLRGGARCPAAGTPSCSRRTGCIAACGSCRRACWRRCPEATLRMIPLPPKLQQAVGEIGDDAIHAPLDQALHIRDFVDRPTSTARPRAWARRIKAGVMMRRRPLVSGIWKARARLRNAHASPARCSR